MKTQLHTQNEQAMETSKALATHFDGTAFNCMSDEYLIECFDTLCVRTSVANPHPDDWLNEWDACRHELMARLRAGSEATSGN